MREIVWMVMFVGFAGCVPPANQQPPQYGTPSSGNQPVASGGPSSCTQLIGCLQGCNQDNPCFQGCLAAADPDAQSKLTAMMQCNSARCENQGSDCIDAQCGPEVQACRGPVQVAEAPQQSSEPQSAEQMRPGQPHTTANLLPWLQQGDGQWIGTNHQFTFFPDGRVRRVSGAAMYTDRGTYGCVSTINDEGTVRQEGDILVMDFGTQDHNHCGHQEDGPALTVRYQITWYQYSDLPVNLLLVDLGCTKDSMYCNNQMRKR